MTTYAKSLPLFRSAGAPVKSLNAKRGLTLSGLINLLAKSLILARSIPESGPVSVEDMAKVRRAITAM